MNSAIAKQSFSAVILGEPASKSNSRQLIKRAGKIISIKSRKALNYVITFQKQCPRLQRPLQGDLRVDMEVFYASRRSDLDVSLILDAMQKYIYENDRQVKEQHLYWRLDKDNPRTVIQVTEL